MKMFVIFIVVIETFIFADYTITDDVKLAIKGPIMLKPLRGGKYEIKVKNKSSKIAKSIQVIGIKPKKLSYMPLSLNYNKIKNKSSAVIIKIEKLAPGKEKKIFIYLKPRPRQSGFCSYRVKLCGDMGNSQLAITEKSIGIKIAWIGGGAFSYDTEDPVEVGQQTTYVVPIRNEGSKPCTKVWIVNRIPKEMEFVKAVGPTEYWYDPKKKTVIFAPLPILHPGEKATYKVICRAVKEGSAKNRAILYYDQFTKGVFDEEGTSVYK